MVELKCKNCGGIVKRDESKVFTSGESVIVLAGHGFECQHCGSRFEPGSTHQKGTVSTQVAIGSNIAQASGGSVAVSGGGIAIQGSVGGDIVVGGKAVIFDRRRK